jgi:hypothetical protein
MESFASTSSGSGKTPARPTYWDLFLANGIPFRFHWGKFVPAYDFPFWADHYRTSLPRFDAFLEVRQARDPDNVFFTQYWRQRFTGQA